MAIAAFSATACRQEGGDQVRRSILTQGYRIPDDEGTVTEVTAAKLTLDGQRTYPIDREVESFSSRDHRVTPLVHWKDRYVHLGLETSRGVIWIAGIGVVTDDQPPRVFYSGKFERIDNQRRAIFADGTALKVGGGLAPPAQGDLILVVFDPVRKEIISFGV